MSSSKILRDKKALSSYTVEDMSGRLNGVDDVEAARNHAEDIVREARRKKESIEMEAYRQGLEQGQAEGRKMALKRLEPLASTMKQAMDNLENAREKLTEQHLTQLLNIVLLIAEKVIHREINQSSDTILNTVRAASTRLSETDEILLRLHPSDYEYIREIENILDGKLTGRRNISFVEDNTIERGGVLIETEFGDVDATIRSQIEQIRDVLKESAWSK